MSGKTRRAPGVRRAFSPVPLWIYVPASVAALLILVPLIAMGTRLDWRNFFGLITSESSRQALSLSLQTASSATVLCILVGVPLAVVLARSPLRGLSVLRAGVLLPLVLPPVVGGLALLYTFGRRGLIGAFFEVLGIQIAFSTAAVVLAQTFVALPFMVLSLEGALRTHGEEYEVVATTLGASPTTVFRRITLPLLTPALVSGTILTFARALGEFGATITFAGSIEGVTRTVPLEIYLQRVKDPEAAIALSFVLIFFAVVITVITAKLAKPASQ